MLRFKRLIVVFFIVCFFIFCSSHTVTAECSSKEECEKIIKEYETKILELNSEKDSISKQIGLMNSQISITSIKIKNTTQLIDQTTNEISALSSKIVDLNNSLDYLSKVLLSKISEGYKNKDVSVFDLFLNTNNASVLINKIKYLKVAQRNDQMVAFKLQKTKFSFEEQKRLREEKQKELEKLNTSLTTQKNELNNQKSQKETLLSQTKMDEKKYQQLLAQALAEFQAIQKAVNTGSVVGPVKKGDPIALVGNSGYPHCSTGPHLHFEIRQNNSWINPYGYLTSKTNIDGQNEGESTNGSGSWDWPLQDPIVITQHYGQTPYSWRYAYSGGVHTGIDLTSKSSNVIRAPADGTLYTSSQKCGSSTMNVKYIDHGGDLVSFYLHVQ